MRHKAGPERVCQSRDPEIRGGAGLSKTRRPIGWTEQRVGLGARCSSALGEGRGLEQSSGWSPRSAVRLRTDRPRRTLDTEARCCFPAGAGGR